VAYIPSLSLELAARCDLGTSLRVQVVVDDGTGGTSTLSTLAFTPEDEWSQLTLELTSSSFTAEDATRVIAVGIVKTGLGVCEISEMIIDEEPYYPGC
jgi:hypothetical protein